MVGRREEQGWGKFLFLKIHPHSYIQQGAVFFYVSIFYDRLFTLFFFLFIKIQNMKIHPDDQREREFFLKNKKTASNIHAVKENLFKLNFITCSEEKERKVVNLLESREIGMGFALHLIRSVCSLTSSIINVDHLNT